MFVKLQKKKAFGFQFSLLCPHGMNSPQAHFLFLCKSNISFPKELKSWVLKALKRVGCSHEVQFQWDVNIQHISSYLNQALIKDMKYLTIWTIHMNYTY